MATTTYFGAQNPLSRGISRSPPHSGPVLDSSAVGRWVVGVALAAIQQVVEAPVCAPLPRAERWWSGVAVYEDEMLVCASLRLEENAEDSRPPLRRARLLLLRHGGCRWGLEIDRVGSRATFQLAGAQTLGARAPERWLCPATTAADPQGTRTRWLDVGEAVRTLRPCP